MTAARRQPLLRALLLTIAAFVVGPVHAQTKERPKHLRFELSLEAASPFSPLNEVNGKAGPQRGEVFYLVLRGTPQEGWYTYPATKLAPGQAEAQRSRVQVLSPELVPVGPIEESEAKLVNEPGIGQYYKYEGTFTWKVPLLLRPTVSPGKPVTLQVRVEAMVCQKQCIDETYRLSHSVPVHSSDAIPLTPDQEKAIKAHEAFLATLDKKSPGAAPPPPTPGEFNWREYTLVKVQSGLGMTGQTSGLWGIVLTAILGGLISLVTPCVFPMIPITVSFFLKQSETTGGKRALLMAGVYSGTLVLVLTIGGVVLGSFLQEVAQHWVTNLFLTAVFIFFGLSLLGMYEIQLPSWLADATSSREGQGGLTGIIFMALTFSIISFACVGPIYGGFTALSATSTSAVAGWTARIAGPLAFSVAFASPFFVLALFPQLLKAMPRSGGWMNTIKVVLGFLELAAAFKFVRTAELNFLGASEFFTFDLVLGLYVALAIGCGLYLLNVYRLPHDYTAVETISVPRLFTGLIFLALALYLLPGLFKDAKGHSQKPRGTVYEWTRSFLLPDDPSQWSANLAQAFARAEREGKPVFIDFTGLG